MDERNGEVKEAKKVFKIKLWVVLFAVLIVIGIIIWSNRCKEYKGEFQEISYIASEEFRNLDLDNMINSVDDYKIISDYNAYKELLSYVKNMSYSSRNISNKYDSSFFDENSLLIVEYCFHGAPNLYTELTEVKEKGTTVTVKINRDTYGVTADVVGSIYIIPVSKNVKSAIVEYENVSYYNHSLTYTAKPIIYLYPEEKIELSVKLGNPENVTCSYPKYEDGWNVIAKADGTLTDIDTGRSLYALYWEGISTRKGEIKEGFVVKGEDTIKFLEEKLELLGLNEREAEEFIVYWLPLLQENEYNYIRFASIEEIDEDMPLEFSVEPDTLIRVLMEFKGLDEYIEVPEQKLETPKRDGFVVVEWGGTELK